MIRVLGAIRELGISFLAETLIALRKLITDWRLAATARELELPTAEGASQRVGFKVHFALSVSMTYLYSQSAKEAIEYCR